jgi:hypothetical protein
VLLALMAILTVSALGAALTLGSLSEALISGNFRRSGEVLQAASAALDRTVVELEAIADWDAVLEGSITSRHSRGSGGPRRVGGRLIDPGQIVSLLNCVRLTDCSPADLVRTTRVRPWAQNNPQWRVFSHGPLPGLGLGAEPLLAVVLVADDPAENDGDPLRDGDPPDNPGAGRIQVRAHVFGPGGSRAEVDAMVERRPSSSDVRVVAWRFPVR